LVALVASSRISMMRAYYGRDLASLPEETSTVDDQPL
jgi:hypothetical protein